MNCANTGMDKSNKESVPVQQYRNYDNITGGNDQYVHGKGARQTHEIYLFSEIS